MFKKRILAVTVLFAVAATALSGCGLDKQDSDKTIRLLYESEYKLLSNTWTLDMSAFWAGSRQSKRSDIIRKRGRRCPAG